MSSYIEFEEEKTLSDYVKAIRRHKKKSMMASAIIFTICVLSALFWPPTYRSTATILIEDQDIPSDMVRSTVTTYANKQIQEIKQRAMTLNNIMDLVKKYELYSKKELDRIPRSEIAEDFREDSKLEVISAKVVDPRSGRPTEATIAFTLSFEHKNPVKAQKVANDLVSIYLRENIKQREAQARNASEFLGENADSLDKEMSEYEERIADFKQEHKWSMPELFNYNMQSLERTEREVLDLDEQKTQYQRQLLKLKGQLKNTSAYAPAILADGNAALSDTDRLKALRSQYGQMVSRYTENHPDVIRIKNEIKRLEDETGSKLTKPELAKRIKQISSQLISLEKKYTSQHPEVISKREQLEEIRNTAANYKSTEDYVLDADNPLYVQLQSEISAVELSEANTTVKIRLLNERAEKLRRYIAKSPEIETRYQELIRNYQLTSMKYGEISTKQREADIAVELESNLRAERFTLIEPPARPQMPVSPNRIAILIVGLVLSIGAGVAVALVLDMLDKSIRGNERVLKIAGAMPLVTVGYIQTPDEIKASEPNRRRIVVIISSVMMIIVGLTMINFLYKPVDVLWFVALRKLGI
ncbi:hypothetical protein SIN8267_03451 [Sinobacterium norvegicum]|uniref:Lipopolysaccharide biosynthesis protein n=1 Tax=Sinobacterium norvegicum TaxID=1641715 RepID=A0ABN8ELM2_9GAMM|nr:hypothetical protein [Sinobacterium norvegicum]CAH0993303.1 hypothetical protein SIN8267_03451 [Sinobacterium norvegicum]